MRAICRWNKLRYEIWIGKIQDNKVKIVKNYCKKFRNDSLQKHDLKLLFLLVTGNYVLDYIEPADF